MTDHGEFVVNADQLPVCGGDVPELVEAQIGLTVGAYHQGVRKIDLKDEKPKK